MRKGDGGCCVGDQRCHSSSCRCHGWTDGWMNGGTEKDKLAVVFGARIGKEQDLRQLMHFYEGQIMEGLGV